MFDGLEMDMLSLGDADCLLISQWTTYQGMNFPWRILVDGGSGENAAQVIDFLIRRDFTNLWAVVCSHLHKDHARGLIKIVQHPKLTIQNGWMHDIRNHIGADALRRAMSGNSTEADAVKEIVETTKELAAAFASRSILPQEPFAGSVISPIPIVTVLGPTQQFYKSALEKFAKIDVPTWISRAATAALAGGSTAPLSTLLGGAPKYEYAPAVVPGNSFGLPPLSGILGDSSVKVDPVTQPFNNTSAILGVISANKRLLLTADAGSDALDAIAAEWKDLHWMQVPHHGSDGNLSQKNIERFRPRNAYISCCGDSSHPSRAIVNGLIKVGAEVYSTHYPKPTNLHHHIGVVPARADYGPAVPMKGQADPVDPISYLIGTR